MRVEIVPHLAQALALRKQHDQPIDRGRKRAFRARSLPEQRHDLRMSREEFELRGEGEPETLERPTGRVRQFRQRRFQLAGGLREHGLEEAALGVVVVEQQLLVDTGPPRDLLDSRAREATPGELLASGCDNP